MIVGKVWGTTEPLLVTATIEIHRLRIKPEMQCSDHCHEHKWNMFYVMSGQLTIEVHKNAYALTDVTVLGPGDCTTVRPNEYHRFVSGNEHVEAFEIYYLEPLSEDIIRRDCGGAVRTAMP